MHFAGWIRSLFPSIVLVSLGARRRDAVVSIATAIGILLAVLRPGVASAQQPDAENEERPVPQRLDERPGATPEAPRSLLHHRPRSEDRGKVSTLSSSAASLFMRAGAGLTGVDLGSSSAIGDVNEDGNPDLLVTGRIGDKPTATLYLGSDDGTFSVADADLDGAYIYTETSITDVDGDGHLDIFITGEDGSNLDVDKLYWGHGDGTFSEANLDLKGGEGGSHSVADVNGDGHQDILITGRESGGGFKTTLYLGNEDRTFSAANADLKKADFGSTSIADVNEDGHPDILITGRPGWSASPAATLYLGNGDGTFSEANAGLVGVEGSSSSIADLNGDGHLDLVITGNDESLDPTATLYLGNGNGDFSEAGANLSGVFFGSTSIADVNGDGTEDLLITGQSAEETLTTTMYLGDGDGTFSTADAGLTGVWDGDSSVGDLDGDGDQDLLITGEDQYFGPSARIYVNRTSRPGPNRSPRFSRTFSVGPLAAGLTLNRHLETGDPNGDLLSIELAEGPSSASLTDAGNGLASFAFSPDRNQGGNDVSFRFKAQDSKGATASVTTSVEVSSVMAALPAGLAEVENGSTSIADVNGDEHPDLLVTGEQPNGDPSATLYLGNEDGTFSEAGANLTGTLRGSTSIGDVDGDGHEDLLITGLDANDDPTTTLYLGNGDGTFTEASANLGGVRNSSSAIADLNGDGHTDLLISGYLKSEGVFSPTTILYEGNGDGTFQKADTDFVGLVRGSVSVADINGDGNRDILLTGMPLGNPEVTELYLGNALGEFDKAGTNLTGVFNSSSSIADVNKDGHSDLLVTGTSENGPTSTLYLGNGDGTFSEANAGLAGVEDGASSIADVNGDEKPDLLITGSGTSTLYLGNGDGTFSEADVGLSGAENSSTSLADVDGDRDPDLLITGRSATTRLPSTVLYENLYDAPLPVEMASFNAADNGEEIRLTWETALDTSYVGFRVQRRSEGEAWGAGAWQTIGQVERDGGTSESEGSQEYQFTDESPPYKPDTLAYRLKLIDTDGSPSFSAPIGVDRSVSSPELLGTFPNPARGQVTLRYAVPERQNVTLRLYDVLGRRVRTILSREQQGRKRRTIDVSGLSSGVYFLRLRAGGQTRFQKLMVVR